MFGCLSKGQKNERRGKLLKNAGKQKHGLLYLSKIGADLTEKKKEIGKNILPEANGFPI